MANNRHDQVLILPNSTYYIFMNYYPGGKGSFVVSLGMTGAGGRGGGVALGATTALLFGRLGGGCIPSPFVVFSDPFCC